MGAMPLLLSGYRLFLLRSELETSLEIQNNGMGLHRRETMIPEKQRKSEERFNEWLESIHYVDREGNILPVILTDDESPDPEGDREGAE